MSCSAATTRISFGPAWPGRRYRMLLVTSVEYEQWVARLKRCRRPASTSTWKDRVGPSQASGTENALSSGASSRAVVRSSPGQFAQSLSSSASYSFVSPQEARCDSVGICGRAVKRPDRVLRAERWHRSPLLVARRAVRSRPDASLIVLARS